MKEIYTNRLALQRWIFTFRSAVVMLLFVATGMQVSAQVSTYTFSQTNGTFTALTGGTVLGVATGNTTTTNLNSNVYPVTIPFAFNFNGQNYTDLNVSSNGFITFGATVPTTTNTSPISSTIAFDGVVSAFGHDISSFFNIAGQTGDIRWETVGAAPNREIVIQWSNFRPTSLTTTTSVYSFSFQIRLRETTNTIAIVYSGGSYLVGSTSYSAAINQVGLRGATNADFNNRFNDTTTPYTNSVAGTANGDDQAFNTTNAVPGMPSDGLTYTWIPPACYPPTALSTGTVTASTAVINWVAPLAVPALGYDVYYNTTGIAPDATTVLDASNSVTAGSTALSATLNSLSAATQYYVWVRARCSTTDASVWTSHSFQTACVAAVTVPYSQNFDTTPVGSITNTNAPVCWRYTEPAGWPGYGYVSTNNSSTPNGYYLYSTDTTGGGMLVSPQTTNLMNGLNLVRFKASAGGTGYNLQVGTVSDPNDASTFTAIGNPIALGASTVWAEYTVYLPAGTNQYLAFRHPGQTGGGTSLRLDDIFIEAAPTCVEPTNLSVTGKTLNSVSLLWSAPNVSTPTGYTIYYSTVNTAPTASTVLDATNSVTVSGLSATVGNLNPSTTYYFWVRSICSGSDFSVWSNPAVSGYTGYCVPATGATTTRYVETLTTTGGMTNLNYSAASYTPYVDESATTFSTYPSGTINYSIDASTTSSTYYYIWIDWNNDLDFEDTGEKVLGTGSVATATGSLTIPSTTALGSYRVRVAAATVSTIGACGTPANGNYVDFTLVVAAPTGCIAPSNLSAANETYNSAQVSWSASVTPPANGYQVYYSTSATPPTASTVLNSTNSVTGIPTTTYNAVISALTPLTTYYFWVRSVCSGTLNSDWTLVNGSFSTLCQPPAIISVTGATVCNNTATLSATADSGATITWYDAPTGGNTLTTGNSYTTPNLSSTTNYYVSALLGSSESVGVANPGVLTNAGTTTAGTTFYMEATVVNTPITIQSVDVFPNDAGNSSFIRVYLGTASTPVYEIPFTSNVASGGVTPQTVPLNIVLSPGVYRFKIEGAGSYYRNYLSPGGVGQAFPYGQGNFTLTGGSNVTTGYYLFYNFIVGSTCESARTMVTATVDCTMGTSETESIKEVQVYPNPFTDVVNISDAKDLKSVSVFDMSGRLVKTVANPGRQINLSELKSGLYILKLNYKDGTVKTVKALKK